MSRSELVTGLVLRVDAKVCHVEVDGQRHKVPLRGRLFETRSSEKRPVAAGDRVRLTLVDGQGAIEEVLPRSSKLARKAAGDDDREQVIAANITRVMIVSAVREPPLQTGLIDRIIASCERQSLPVLLVLTKMDRDKKRQAKQWIDLYRGLGYEVLPTSIHPGKETHETLAQLEQALSAGLSVLTGLSGVGKSSLLNHIMPGLDLRIGSMNRIRQGRHTTSHTELIALPSGGYVLDTPGIRNFGLFGVDPREITFYFREMKSRVGACAYRNCTHSVEPDCQVRDAVEAGEIEPSRYESYLALFAELRELEQREHEG